MKILIAAETMYAFQGGPSNTIRAMANALVDAGCEVTILTDGYDVEMPAGLKQVVLRKELRTTLAEFVAGFDLVHDNAVWLLFHNALARACSKAGIPRVISPRGGLMSWILRQRWLKKKLGWWLYQRKDLLTADAVFATAENEAKAVRDLGYEGRVCIHPNGAQLPKQPRSEYVVEGPKRALFLSRIHTQKGITDLVDAWCALAPHDWELSIAGPDNDGIMQGLLGKLEQSGLSRSVRYLGMIEGTVKENAYSATDLFILPTYSENFGNVILEAMLMGVPVLTTTGTPWAELSTNGCGWICEPGLEPLTVALQEILPLDKGRLFERGQKARETYTGAYSWPHVAEEMMASYREIIAARKDRP